MAAVSLVVMVNSVERMQFYGTIENPDVRKTYEKKSRDDEPILVGLFRTWPYNLSLLVKSKRLFLDWTLACLVQQGVLSRTHTLSWILSNGW